MGRARWVGADLYRLLNLPVSELVKIYPQYSKGTLKGKKSYWKKQLKEGKIEMPNPETTEVTEGRLVKSWEVAMRGQDGEWDTTTLHAYDHSTETSVDDLFPQVEAARITPTRRKQIQRAGRLALAYGDGQVGFRRIIDPLTEKMELVPSHNLPVHRIILQMNAHYMPETTINGGDFADNAEISRFPAGDDHYHKTMTPSYRWIHDFYAQMVSDNPRGEHYEVASNHGDERIKRKILKDAPQFYDFYRPGEEYPAWTYYSMANLGRLGIKFLGGYKAAILMYAEDTGNPIGIHHGHHSSSTPGATVRKEMAENPDINIVRFHGHNYEAIMRTHRDGRQLIYVQLPSSCVNNKTTPGYRNAVDDFNRPVEFYNPHHQNGFAIIKTSPDGRHQIDFVNVENGKAWYDGILWDGNTPYEWEKRYGYLEDENGNT